MSDISTNISNAMAAANTPKAAAPQAPAAASKETPTKAPEGTKEPASTTPKEETPKNPEKKIWKIKADGEEFDFDASDEEVVKREISKARGANKRFEEAAALRKQVEGFMGAVKDAAGDHRKLAQLLQRPEFGGADFRKLAEQAVWDQLQEEALTPEQRKQKDVERELEKYREAEKKSKESAEQREAAELQSRYEGEYEQTILQALQAGGIPNTRGAVRRMAHYIQVALNNNVEVSHQELAARVRQDIISEHREMYGTGDGASLLSILGEDLAKKIREADVKRLKSTQPEAHRRAPGNAKPVKPAERKRGGFSQDSLKAMLEEKLKG